MFGDIGATYQVKQKRGIFGQEGGNGNNQFQQQQQGWGGQQQQGWGGQQQQGWGGQQQGWGGQQQQQQGWGGQQQQPQNQGWGQQQSGWGKQQVAGQQSWGQQGWGQKTWGNHLEGQSWVDHQAQLNNSNFLGSDVCDLTKFLEQQIIGIEPSPSKAKLEELRKKGQKFLDDRFPPNQNSLSGEWGNIADWKDIKWKKISEALPQSKIFQGKVEPQDIKQGYLGDCYFLAGLAAIAERPDRIFNLFLLQDQNQLNYYSVKLLYKGKWVTVDIDEYVPFMDGKPAFSKSINNELWVILLEKAWAKIYTSYKRIAAGYPEEPLHDLTGAPIKNIYLKKSQFNAEKEWNYLMEASRLQYSMVCSSNSGSDSDKSFTGVVQGHAYTVMSVVTLQYQGQAIRLVKLRNPWGKGQFKGEWCDSDQRWNNVDPREKQRIGFIMELEDGIFFIPYQQFCQQFRSVTIAQVNDNASYVYKSYTDKQSSGCYFKVVIAKPGRYSFQVDKTPQRIFEDKRQDNYNYPNAVLQVAQFNNGSIVKKLEGIQSANRLLAKSYDLQPGTYISSVKMDFNPNYQQDYNVNLAIYAEFPCTITLASHQEAVALSGNNGVKWSGEDQETPAVWNNMGAYGYDSENGWGGSNNQNQGGNNNQNQGGNNGWGVQGGGNVQNNNSGWGNSGNNQNNSNSGWGEVQGGGNNQGGWQTSNNNNGWGNNEKKNEWSNQPNNSGWNNQSTNQANNSGWNNQSSNNQGNNGWNQGGNNSSGW